MSNIHPFSGPAPAGQAPAVANVVVTESGRAVRVELEDGQTLNVVDHLEETPWLSPGERVLISVAPQGAVVLGRLARHGAVPPPPLPFTVDETGQITLDAPRGLVIQVGDHARIALDAQGKVRIEGEEVSSLARGRMALRGVTIDLN